MQKCCFTCTVQYGCLMLYMLISVTCCVDNIDSWVYDFSSHFFDCVLARKKVQHMLRCVNLLLSLLHVSDFHTKHEKTGCACFILHWKDFLLTIRCTFQQAVNSDCKRLWGISILFLGTQNYKNLWNWAWERVQLS